MKRLFTSLLGLIFIVAAVPAPGEDIDLFMGVDDSPDTNTPNVMILIDNTANWNTAFTAEMAALASVVNGLTSGQIRLGFMMYSETGGGNGNTDGGYVRAAARRQNDDRKPLYKALVESFHILNDKSNNGKLGLAMAEAYEYYKGIAAEAGATKIKRDYAGNVVSGYPASNAIYALEGNAFSDAGDSSYNSPWSTERPCRENYVIFLSNGKSNSNTSDNTRATTLLSAAGGDTTAVPILPNGFQDEVADEWARFLANRSTPKVITYVVDVVPTVKGQYSDDYKALLKSIATQGGGKYYDAGAANAADLGSKLVGIFQQIFNEIAAVNSAFSSASLPVSVNTQGVYLNQVFIGMFRPESDRAPRWNGNLKQYQMTLASDGTIELADSTQLAAINPLTGFITPCARSYWTPTAVDTYWTFKQGTFLAPCASVAGAAASNTPDGDAVEKGAAGYRLRAIAPSSRAVKTCTGTCTTLSDFNTANTAITATALGVSSSSDRTSLINWVRGQDLQEEQNNNNTAEMRPSVHGDVVHSQPLAVDYGGTTGVVTFYGGNDGMLHAVEGNKGLDQGDELWSFVAPETYGRFWRPWGNWPSIRFPAFKPSAACYGCSDFWCAWTYGCNKDYFIDGQISGYRTSATPPATWIYATMRRGGRRIFAFDVSTPATPTLLWRLGCPAMTGTTGCDTDLGDIGQTWSAVQTFKTLGYVDAVTPSVQLPLAIFGGGYDVCEDNEPNTCSAPIGDHIYVVDATSGTLLKTFNTVRSVAADVTMVDSDADGLVDLGYAVDTGGNIYRINTRDSAGVNQIPSNWTLTQIAALGCDSPPCTASGVRNRKFLFAPEAVVTRNYIAVLVGSGDREHPLAANDAINVDNAFFMLRDKPTAATWLSEESTRCTVGMFCLASLLSIAPDASNPTSTDCASKKGWYLAFGTDATVSGRTVVHNGEQVVTAALTIGGIVYFSTHTPTASTAQVCGPNLGTARGYAVGFTCAADPTGTGIRYSTMAGGGLPPSPVGGLVDINGKTVPFVIGGRNLSGGVSSGLAAQNAGLIVPGVRTRTHWYIEPSQ